MTHYQSKYINYYGQYNQQDKINQLKDIWFGNINMIL